MTFEEASKALERSLSKTDAWTRNLESRLESTQSATATIKTELSAALDGIEAGVSLGVEISESITKGFSEAVGFSAESQNTLSQFDEKTKGTTLTETQETVYTFDPAFTPAGYYKYMPFAMVDVFGIVIYNPTTEKAVVSTVSEYAMLYNSWAYSEDKYWENNISPEMLTLDVDNLTFEEPEK